MVVHADFMTIDRLGRADPSITESLVITHQDDSR